MSPIDEQGAIAAITELARQEQSGDFEPLILQLGPFTAYMLVTWLQLVTRHPHLRAEMLRTVVSVGRSIQGQLPEVPAAILEIGWDPAQDVPRLAHECEHQASNFMPCRVCGA